MGFRYKHWTKFCLPLALLFCLILPSLGRSIWASNDSADEKLHYIVRYWHADGTHEDEGGDKEQYLEKGSSSVIIDAKKKAKKGETFAGFATAAGHDAVERDTQSSTITISYKEDIHLVKVHAFYKDTNLEKKGSVELGGEETKVDEDGTKVYNTAKKGLHTDKTAEVLDEAKREFQLTLESWYVEKNQSDVGMVLDASGSMAFTSNNLEPIKMTEEQIEKYKKLTYIPQKDVDKILNPRYTDNSKLGYSGYTYFVYDPSDGTQEYVPIGYWNGVAKSLFQEEKLPQVDKLSGYYSFDKTVDNKVYNEVEVVKDGKTIEDITDDKKLWTAKVNENQDGIVSKNEGTNPVLTGNSKNGFNGTNNALDLGRTYHQKEAAAALDIKPESKSFTISFAVRGTSPKPIVWIGNADQREKQAWYEIYVDTDGGTTEVLSGVGTATEDNKKVEATGNVSGKLPNKGDWNVCTYVFEEKSDGTTVTIYADGNEEKIGSGSLDRGVIDEDAVIVLGGSAWKEDYGGDDWPTKRGGEENAVSFPVDELYFYDCALSEGEVGDLYKKMTGSLSSEYAATTDSGQTMGLLNHASFDGTGAGWYYVSSGRQWSKFTNENLLTAKVYNGIPQNEIIYNQIDKVPDGTKKPENGNSTKYIDTGGVGFVGEDGDSPAIKEGDSWNGSIIFYIDAEGYLRCFANRGSAQVRDENGEIIWKKNESFCSYVYKKNDLQRIKTEALQLALGSFVTKLNEVSPKSEVSAVRFSTEDNMVDSKGNDNTKSLKNLVLQDWTTDPMESTGMLGLRRGNRTATDSYPSKNGLDQYNYVLTGDTATWTGLQSYIDNLDGRLEKNDSAKKSLIIFTDGKDTTGEEGQAKAIKLADRLKSEGYTIYCVMMQSAGNPPDSAKDFLEKLSSGDEDSKGDYVFYADDVESLTEAFTKEILNRIVNNLPDYTVQDYIDPRFNLVNADGSVVYLNAGGNILVDGKKMKVDSDGYKIHITETTKEDAVGTVGENARLFYDQDKDMYYLRWTGQTIPGCSTGAEHLNVWKTRIKVRAKKDFIGGNAVISNGNADSMNMVFHPDDKDKSSGQDDIYAEKDEETGKIRNYPSKGFPRTTVNVALLNLKLEDAYQKIYMGETIVPEDAFSALAGKVEEKVYYEYLERFEYWISQQKDGESQNLLAQLKAGNQIRIPYYYLPDKAGSNQAGKVQPGDQIGWLTYGWKDCDKNGVLKSNPTYSPFETTDTVSRYYQLAVSYMPMTEEERNKETAKIISDQDYTSPKKAVGTEQKNEVRGLGLHQTDIVNGEIIVEAKVLLSDLKKLTEKGGGKLKANQSFTLVRSYNGKESKSELKVVFSYTAKKLKSLKANKDGYVSIFSKPSDPLPIGQYTMKIKGKTPFQFDTISTKKIKNGNSHFSETYTKEKKESQYAAPRTQDQDDNSVSFYLGVPLSEEETKVNLNARLGHAVVTYTKEPETKKDDPSSTRLDDDLPKGRTYANDKAPATGDRADLTHVLILMISSAALIIMPMMRKRQYR